ncbi:MAG TPA: hypothetical protein VFE16_14390 [Candidatus Cybelea sp.]|jgi:hypothetical protein|nr:hypothetical protein [Candidatus Cybelea sp.]
MKFSTLIRLAAVTCVAVAMTACGAQQGGAPTAAGSTFQDGPDARHSGRLRMLAKSTRIGLVPQMHHKNGKSWIRPDAGRQYLLYASDLSKGTIDIYNYRVQAGKLYGQITGLDEPYGQCIDKARDVYVVDEGTSTIYEFAHGGITPIATAVDDFGLPNGCSVDPTTGNVAVSNFSGVSSGSGGIDIFAGGLSGAQEYYTDGSAAFMWPPGYDVSGNLFVEGQNLSGANVLLELPSGTNQFNVISGVSIGFPGGVQRWKTYMAVTDQSYQGGDTTAIYTISLAGSAATIVHTTELTDDCYPSKSNFDAVQPFLNGTTPKKNAVVAGNLSCSNRMDFFNFTNGGNPKRALPSDIAPFDAWGQSVSPPTGKP